MSTAHPLRFITLPSVALLIAIPLFGEESMSEKRGMSSWDSAFSNMCYQGPDRCDEWIDGSGSNIGASYYVCNGLYNFHTLVYVVYYCEA